MDEQEEGTPIRRMKPREWLSIDPKSPLPKTATVAIPHYAWW